MAEIIKVGMADLKVCKAPDALTTLGLGSCVGIALWDRASGVGGLAHIMLPDSTKIKNNSNRYKFADSAIDELIREVVAHGAARSRIKAKIVGGASMFAFQSQNEEMQIGKANVDAVKIKLKKAKEGEAPVAIKEGQVYNKKQTSFLLTFILKYVLIKMGNNINWGFEL